MGDKFTNKLLVWIVTTILAVALPVCGKDSSPTNTLSGRWSVTQKGSILEIGYGSDIDFPQYAALHLESSYFRMNYGPSSEWGTSVILLPSFEEGGILYQGAPVTATWEIDANDLIISITGEISGLSVQVQICIFPPGQNSISAATTVTVNGNLMVDSHSGETFKLVTLASMYISPDEWDAQSAYIDSQTFQIPESGWIIQPPITGSIFGLKGGTSTWKHNAPTIEIALEESRPIIGWVTPSDDPNDDNMGFWATSDKILSSWTYTITAKP